jgi:hypothetical protein
MRFHEARKKFQELEAKLFSGELTEGEFLDRVAQLRVTDEEGREWIIGARNGRWLVHDGRQWVAAEPPQEKDTVAIPPIAAPPPTPSAPREPRKEPTPTRPRPRRKAARQAPVAAARPAAAAKPREKPTAWLRRHIPFPTSRALSGTLTALLIVACLVGAGVSAWVLFLRDLGEPETANLSAEATPLPPVETFTPRPATATFAYTDAYAA